MLFSAVLLAISVTPHPDGAVTINTPKAQFDVSPAGSIRAWLLDGGQRLTLEDPGPEPGDTLRADGAEITQFTVDPSAVKVSDAAGPLGAHGKRVVISSRAQAGALIRILTLEIYDDFPALLISTVAYRNAGSAPLRLDRLATQRHRIDASLADSGAEPFRLWSFHGAASTWGQDDVVEITRDFSRPNDIGAATRDGYGGGVPVVAFWTRRIGLAIGHLETLPEVLSIPVGVGADARPRADIELDAGVTLKPGETFFAPRTFEMVYSGDYYEPLRMYSLALQRRGWKLPAPTNEDYAISWCGWGYEFNVTAKEMLGIVPKLKEYGIHWATLDDRWFDTYGDWNPRPDTFPSRSIQDMVREYHRNGIKVQIWWLPIAAELPGKSHPSHQYIQSRVAREHPDWLILDQDGHPALMARGLATLCPALKEVRDYHRRLTLRFIRDWDFDGHKLDNIFSVPECYNPKHHHKSPKDSVNAMREVYRVIFETTRALKPDSVTQACPCGTPPNIAWLPYMDQAVTADPIGALQVRRRVKMYKALLGPAAPVYGDHVELTELERTGNGWREFGRDFASSIGTGAVVGTKFVWPQTDAKYQAVALTPDKDRDWKKWIAIYHAKMLSRGEFRNLYVIGYDAPEGYVIAKGGKLYFAFFTPKPGDRFQGEIELRGLAPGEHRVLDYVNNKDYGSVTAAHPRLAAEFTGSLLLEVQ